jgi:hypothetical protein
MTLTPELPGTDVVTGRWLTDHSWNRPTWTVAELVAAKAGRTISVVLPALNEEDTVGSGQGGRCQGALQAFGQTHTQSFPDEVLVAECHQDRPSSFYKVVYVAQQTKTVISVLAEIMRRID